AESLENACHIVMDTLHKNENDKDVPFSLIYLIDNNQSGSNFKPRVAYLAATTFDIDQKVDDKKSKRCMPEKLLETLETIDLTKSVNESYDVYIELRRNMTTHLFLKCKSWPIDLVIREDSHAKVVLNDESQAILFPVKIQFHGRQILSAVLICGINPSRPLDKEYMEFLQLVVNQVSLILTQGALREDEKKRVEMLTDLNRQKVTFFQNISHELRTPLTLMLSPLDQTINSCMHKTTIYSLLQIVQRNTRRLLKLVNNLLQVSNIETGQLKVQYRETNIAKLTKELATNFSNMASKLNLDYIIEIPNPDEFDKALEDKVYLDRDLFETIIYNLCSNAFKHTWNGYVKVRLYIDHEDEKDIIILEVSDTGVGISETDLKNIFQRFYRVESRQSRSHEGTGIGLALVKELIMCHGGDITVSSKVGQGTTFKCQFLTGYEHLPTNQIYNNGKEDDTFNNDQQSYSKQQLYLEENLQWIQNNKPAIDTINQKSMDLANMDIDRSLANKNISNKPIKHKVLIVDDNVDMRNYIKELLEKEFDVYCACDGCDALLFLTNISQLPDLILSGKYYISCLNCLKLPLRPNIMMPNMNGYELLNALRSNTKTELIPIILLTAKAGECSSIKAFDDGVNDYLVKPFNSRQLIARIHTNIKLSKFRCQIISRQCKQEKMKQLLISISDNILYGIDLKEAFSNAVKEIHQILSCCRIFIVFCESLKAQNRAIIALSEDPKANSENHIITKFISEPLQIEQFLETNDSTYLSSNAQDDYAIEIDVSHKTYCIDTSGQIVGFYFEIELFRQISNQINIAINNAILMREKMIKEARIESLKAANIIKSQILANTSHELRTPLGAIVGILSSIKDDMLTDEQQDMINIMTHSSDVALSTINNILDAAKLEAHKITLDNKVFDLVDLLENTIEMFGEKIGNKQIELFLNYDMNTLPKYIKSDPESTEFTQEGEIVMKVFIRICDFANENPENETYDKLVKKAKLMVEVNDTGIGIWESYMRANSSIVRQHNGTGLGLSISKQLVEINGGEIGVESQLGNGSKFWFTWNIDILQISTSSNTINYNNSISPSDEAINNILPPYIRLKRILLIHPMESSRIAITHFLKNFKRVGIFDTCDKGIQAAKYHKDLYNQGAYDIAFINLCEKDSEEISKAALELRRIHDDRLQIVFMVFSNNNEKVLAKKLIENTNGQTAVIYKPITYRKLLSQCMHNNNNSERNIENPICYNAKNLINNNFEKFKFDFESSLKINQASSVTSPLNISKKRMIGNMDNDDMMKPPKSKIKTISMSNRILCDNNSADLKPGMSGFDTSRVIRSMNSQISNIPIIALTASNIKKLMINV
ncbi:8793_t:CDS:10, partial [Scutellospora calospora]